MKYYFIILFSFWGLLLPAQNHPHWQNYTFSQRVTGIEINGSDLWISTQGGLVKYNKESGEKAYFNRANANLPDNNLLSVTSTQTGEVWVTGKYYGIGKLSNGSCTIFNESNSGLPFDQLNGSIKTDDKGNVWLSSFRWLVCYDGNEWKKWKTGSEIHSFPVVSGFVIASDGTVWLTSTDGLGKIENSQYSVIPESFSAINSCINIDKNGDLWIGYAGRGLYHYDGETFTNYTKENSNLPDNSVYCIEFDADDNMWLATAEGLVNFNSGNCVIYEPAVDKKSLLFIKPDENNVIWCGTFSGYLLRFDGRNFDTIDLSNSPLKDNNTLPILNDSEGNVWITTNSNTVLHSASGIVQVFEAGIKDIVEYPDGSFLFAYKGSSGVLYSKKGDQVIEMTELNEYTLGKTISEISLDKNDNLWINLLYHGLIKYDGKNVFTYTQENSPLPSNYISQIAFDSENNLWGGSINGLFKFDGSTWTIWNESNSSIPMNFVNNIIVGADNIVWFSCMERNPDTGGTIVGIEFGGGLTKFDGSIMTTYNIKNSGLKSNTLFGMYDDTDKIWIATCSAGLMSFDKKNKWDYFDVSNSGIVNNITNGVIKDNNGNLWIGSLNAGISVFNPDNSLGLNENKIQTDNEIIIFSNPAKDELIFFIDSDENVIQVEIYDVGGRSLYSNLIRHSDNTYSVPIHNLSNNSLYILSITTSNNIKKHAKFFVK